MEAYFLSSRCAFLSPHTPLAIHKNSQNDGIGLLSGAANGVVGVQAKI
jgi:hypothetical protein